MISAIYLVALSPAISLVQMNEVAGACSLQLQRDVCPAWGFNVPTVNAVAEQGAVPAGGTSLIVARKSDVDGDAGYHTEDATGQPIGYAFTDGQNTDGITTTISHELIEMLGDPNVNGWVWSAKLGVYVSKELADAVEGRTYRINGVAMSDFVFQGWFRDSTPPGVATDFMGAVFNPWAIDDSNGGYVQTRDGITGKIGQLPPDVEMPAHKQHPAARVQRRLGTEPMIVHI